MKKQALDRGFSGLVASSRPWDSLEYSILSFLVCRQVENISPETLKTYRYRLFQFHRFINDRRPDLGITQLERMHINAYLLDLHNKERSPHYVASIHAMLRNFFNWCVTEEIIERSPMRNIKKPKTPKRGKPFLTEAQRDKMLGLCPSNTFLGARGAAIIWFLWTTGMRLNELAGLKLDDIQMDNDAIKVFGKGSRERRVPLLKEAKKALLRYLRLRKSRDHTGKHRHLWLTEEGRPITRDGIDSFTQRLVIRAGLQGEIEDLHHIFRRTWAMRQLKEGIPIKLVQMAGGWSSVTTLEEYVRYMEVDEDVLRANWV